MSEATEYMGWPLNSGAMPDQAQGPARTEGWPAQSGPLHTLHELGLLNGPGRRPAWLHDPTTETIAGGEVYRASTNYLNRFPLVALAALTLEGWTVVVKQHHTRMAIRITRAAEPP